jgi:hypothetical protein
MDKELHYEKKTNIHLGAIYIRSHKTMYIKVNQVSPVYAENAIEDTDGHYDLER